MIDLSSLSFQPFEEITDKVVLGEEQKDALNKIIEFLSSDKTAFSLYGSAGTGKTTITKYIIKHLEKNRILYTLCAPTHKAKVVLERFTNREGITLHKLLSLAPNVEIMNLDFNNLIFLIGKTNNYFPKKGVIICDESSMINDDLFELLIKRCEEFQCKVIFQGDKAQIQPVNNSTHSKVFEIEDRVELTKIYRQLKESGLISVLPILRENVILHFQESIGIQGSLYCYDNVKDFLEKSLPHFKKSIRNMDILEVKLLAYTNDRVRAFNSKIREVFFNNTNEYNRFEFLTGTENFEFNNITFWNSMDYVITDDPREGEVLIPDFIKLPGYYLNLYNSSNTCIEEVFILKRDIPKDYLDSLIYHIETIRLQAVDASKYKSRASKVLWGKYYQIMKSFTSPIDLYYSNRLIRKKSFDYGYSSTVHKSQGSTINNVFIDMKDIKKCRIIEELRQLQYVSVSRAKNNVHILQ
jgi:ATP-dependent exoDNAse (exonuclease V) alpha subunit